MHLAEQGEGPLVILCHGWPESSYSWRHRISALAHAGYRTVAPDQRGYGQTDAPEAIEADHIFHLTADIVGLVHALGEEHAVILGSMIGDRRSPGTAPCYIPADYPAERAVPSSQLERPPADRSDAATR